jgi:hypothetical protein
MESYDTAELARDVYRFITSHISYGIGILYSGNGFQFWIYHDPIAPQEAEDIRNKIVKSLAYEFPNVNIDQTSTNIRRIGALAGSIKRKGYCSTDERPDRVIGYWHDNPKKRLTVQQLKDFAFNLSVDVPSDVFAKKYTKNQSNVIIKWEELGLKESDYNIFELQHEASISRVATALNRGNGNPVCFHTPDHQAKWDPKHPNQWVCWGHRCAEVFPYRQDNPGAKPSYWTPISAVQHVTGMVQAGHAYDWLHQRGLVTTPRPPGINDVVAMRKYNRLYILCTPKQQQEIIKTIYVTSADVDKNNL